MKPRIHLSFVNSERAKVADEASGWAQLAGVQNQHQVCGGFCHAEQLWQRCHNAVEVIDELGDLRQLGTELPKYRAETRIEGKVRGCELAELLNDGNRQHMELRPLAREVRVLVSCEASSSSPERTLESGCKDAQSITGEHACLRRLDRDWYEFLGTRDLGAYNRRSRCNAH